MNTKQVAAELRLSQWAQLMKERSESGLSIKVFCEGKGIKEHIYFYWQRKLREAACEMAQIKTATRQTGLVPIGFSEVKLIEPKGVDQEVNAANQGRIRIKVAGIQIIADSAYPSGKLADLIREISQP